jgi:hypothetical protein
VGSANEHFPLPQARRDGTRSLETAHRLTLVKTDERVGVPFAVIKLRASVFSEHPLARNGSAYSAKARKGSQSEGFLLTKITAGSASLSFWGWKRGKEATKKTGVRTFLQAKGKVKAPRHRSEDTVGAVLAHGVARLLVAVCQARDRGTLQN